jgi:hypothetical protein
MNQIKSNEMENEMNSPGKSNPTIKLLHVRHKRLRKVEEISSNEERSVQKNKESRHRRIR